MRALAKTARGSGLSLISADKPSYGDGEVLIRISKTAICGTDLHIYDWNAWAQKTIPVPMIVGHEFFGEIVALGSKVSALSQFAIGDRVSGEGHIVCGYCRNCRAGREHYCRNTQGVGVNRTGAFAEYLVLPAHNVYPIPDYVDDDIAAMMDPFGNAVHTALTFDLVGEDVLITGAGPIGLMACAIARFVGARHVVVSDSNQQRLALASAMGASLVVPTGGDSLRDAIQQLEMNEGFDVGLEMSGAAAALQDMVAVMNHGGKIALLGIPSTDFAIEWGQVVFKSLMVKGIYGREMFETWYKGLAMLRSGLDIGAVLTHRLPVQDFEVGFAAMRSGASGKVILNWR